MPGKTVRPRESGFTPKGKQDIQRKYGISDEDFKVVTALALRPACEHCNKPLPPDSLEARICSFECTFCARCVDEVLHNVCPNCGGGFVPRPIRPSQNWKNGNYLGAYPASSAVKLRPVNSSIHAQFAVALRILPPEKR